MWAIAIGFFILWLAFAMWVYFDASERGKASIGWALAMFLVGWALVIPIVLYVIFRDVGTRLVVAPGAGRRQYLYVASFVGFATLVIGLSLLISTTIARVISEGALGDDGYRQALAASTTAIIIGVAIWLYHWLRAEGRLRSIREDEEFRATFFLHRTYLYTLFGVSWIIAFLSGMWLLGGGLGNAFGVEDVEPVAWVPALGPLVVALLAVGIHYLFSFETPSYKELLSRFEAIPPPPLIGVTAPAQAYPPPAPPPTSPGPAEATERRFCPHCGARVEADAAFCSSCGERLRSG
jgi:MFS family permease